MNTRQTILVGVGILVILVIGSWWYLGFTLDFMRFFAAEPGTGDRIVTRQSPPPGCYYQNVQCIQAPCDPILVCPPSTGIVECLPTQQNGKVGEAVNLTAQGGTGAYEWFSPEGGRVGGVVVGPGGAITNTYSVVYSKPGTKKVTVQSPRGDGSTNVDSVACTVIVAPAEPQ